MKYVILITAAFFVLIGFTLKYLKWDWLIAGYNTMSKEKKQGIDIAGLRNFLGNSMFIIAGILLAMFVFVLFELRNSILATIVIAAIYFVFMAIYAQRFNKNKADKRKGVIVMVVILALTSAFIVPIFIFGGQETEIVVDQQEIKIKGMYGTTLAQADLLNVQLVDQIPRILMRTNGYAVGSVLKGNFKVEELGNVKLYLMSDQGPYLIIQDQKTHYIVNYKDEQVTRTLYAEITNR